ncbi:DUF3888 domain-containing protein [Paenibacillus tritici]|uniref:DUF3888 domain-containing protein n=1 Tax=Paenibacillus tritici TaxID=1873425 RepID=A0ABX2DPF3_9BACL|nr:DUF3888 domain-containing protein [Paenibacillus tritici]NQX46558.1 DUF3888 domain-containing protein [Paenibacillus tritici]
MLKRWQTVLLVLFLSAFTPSEVLAIETTNTTQENVQLPCDVVKDAFVSSLFKPISTVLAKYNDEGQFMVDMVEVKKLKQGQYYWEATIKVTTFEGAHNPPYHYYTVTLTNLFSEQPKVLKAQQTLKP